MCVLYSNFWRFVSSKLRRSSLRLSIWLLNPFVRSSSSNVTSIKINLCHTAIVFGLKTLPLRSNDTTNSFRTCETCRCRCLSIVPLVVFAFNGVQRRQYQSRQSRKLTCDSLSIYIRSFSNKMYKSTNGLIALRSLECSNVCVCVCLCCVNNLCKSASESNACLRCCQQTTGVLIFLLYIYILAYSI